VATVRQYHDRCRTCGRGVSWGRQRWKPKMVDKDWTTIIQQSKEKHKGKTLNEHESKKKTPLFVLNRVLKKNQP
jgi:hypothetical protein